MFPVIQYASLDVHTSLVIFCHIFGSYLKIIISPPLQVTIHIIPFCITCFAMYEGGTGISKPSWDSKSCNMQFSVTWWSPFDIEPKGSTHIMAWCAICNSDKNIKNVHPLSGGKNNGSFSINHSNMVFTGGILIPTRQVSCWETFCKVHCKVHCVYRAKHTEMCMTRISGGVHQNLVSIARLLPQAFICVQWLIYDVAHLNRLACTIFVPLQHRYPECAGVIPGTKY